jgi:hypothetical protein
MTCLSAKCVEIQFLQVIVQSQLVIGSVDIRCDKTMMSQISAVVPAGFTSTSANKIHINNHLLSCVFASSGFFRRVARLCQVVGGVQD